MNARAHNFKSDLAESHVHQDDAIWGAIYRDAYPDLIAVETPKHDLELQRQGGDRVLSLADGRRFLVEEKRRRKDYRDFAFEVMSSFERETPGWINKPTSAAVFAWIVDPDLEKFPRQDPRPYALLFNAPALWRAWRIKGWRWEAAARNGQYGFGYFLAENDGYRTLNLKVPFAVLLAAIGDGAVTHYSRQRLAALGVPPRRKAAAGNAARSPSSSQPKGAAGD